MFENVMASAFVDHPFSSPDTLWSAFSRLLNANAPRAGCALNGGIGEVIEQIVREQGLEPYFSRNLFNTGNATITMGSEKPQPDVLIVAHMDRPSFRVKSAETGEIYPVCAVRAPMPYKCDAKAIRYDSEQQTLVIGSRGIFTNGENGLHYQATQGDLRWYDTIVMDAEPTLIDGVVSGTGLDNCLGVVTGLGLALKLKQIESTLIEQNKRVMIAFSDEEEGIPEFFFGHGAARLAYHVQPTTGVIICDAHPAGGEGNPALGGGAGHGVITGLGRGSLVAPNFVSLAVDLAESVNQARPGTVQLNTGYLSRSDDMGLSRAMRVLGLIGAPMLNAHTAQEQAHINDVPRAINWLMAFTTACLGWVS